MNLAVLLAALLLLGLGARSAPAAEPAAPWLYDPGAVAEIDFELSEDAIEELEEDPGEYQPAEFTVRSGDVTHPTITVGLRLKGTGSFRTLAGKAAFKVKFNEFVGGQKFAGLKRLTLNNMIQDPSMVHETLSYETFRRLGLPASRSGYALVRINGVVYGTYLNVENLDDVSLLRWYPKTQHLYEGEYEMVNGMPIGFDLRPEDVEKFEVDIGDEDDRTDLEALVAASRSERSDWFEGMAAVADLSQMTRYWAAERYMGHWDGYTGRIGMGATPNNYYLHSDPDGLFTMLPWGADTTWTTPMDFDEPGGLLFNRCLRVAECSDLYVKALEEIRSTIDPKVLARLATDSAALLAPYQALEDPIRRERNLAEVDGGIAEVLGFLAARSAQLDAWLAGPPTPPIDTPEDKPLPRSAPKPRFGPAKVRGRLVATTIVNPGRGRAVLRVDVGSGGTWLLHRVVRTDVGEAGRTGLEVRVSEAVRKLIRRGSARVRARVGFVSADGPRHFAGAALVHSR